MDKIDRQLERLKSPNKYIRCEVCEQLRVAANLSQEAVTALTRTCDDPDPDVAYAAYRALLACEQVRVRSKSIPERSAATPDRRRVPVATRSMPFWYFPAMALNWVWFRIEPIFWPFFFLITGMVMILSPDVSPYDDRGSMCDPEVPFDCLILMVWGIPGGIVCIIIGLYLMAKGPSLPVGGPKMPAATRGKDLGCIGLMIGLLMMIVLPIAFEGTIAPQVLFWVLSFAGVIYLLMSSVEHGRYQNLHETWSELARQMGMSFVPGVRSSFGNHGAPSICGEYRGRHISLSKGGKHEVSSWSDLSVIPAVYTVISLSVANPANLWLFVAPTRPLSKKYGKILVTTGDNQFDHRYAVGGVPREFVQKAVELLMPRRILLLRGPQGTFQLTDNPAWVMNWRRPYIQIRGPELICRQSGVLTWVDTQIAFLDLLCDLAELAEEIGNQSSKCNGAGKDAWPKQISGAKLPQ
jgi:hypothetical protein